MAVAHAPIPALKRSMGLFLTVLYGLGVTIGAGIYVLIGAAAGRAGIHAPLAFAIAGIVMGLTAASFAELVGRMPIAAGEAAYVRAGFGSGRLALLVGVLVIAAGIVAAAAITNGSVGYIRTIVDVQPAVLAAIVLLVMGAIAAVGMLTSAWVAGVMTLIEVGGLIAIVVAGLLHQPSLPLVESVLVVPSFRDAAAWSGVMAATLLSFFAFIGFEGLVNISEEVKRPERTLPRAIFLTLAISTALYMAVIAVAMAVVPRAELALSSAPLALVFERATGAPPHVVTAIAIVATLNGIIAQIILASRVMYGLAKIGDLPGVFGRVNASTQTPLLATTLATSLAILLATQFPIDRLADATSLIILAIFFFVNIALLLIKRRAEPTPAHAFIAPIWVPPAAAASCGVLFFAALLQ